MKILAIGQNAIKKRRVIVDIPFGIAGAESLIATVVRTICATEIIKRGRGASVRPRIAVIDRTVARVADYIISQNYTVAVILPDRGDIIAIGINRIVDKFAKIAIIEPDTHLVGRFARRPGIVNNAIADCHILRLKTRRWTRCAPDAVTCGRFNLETIDCNVLKLGISSRFNSESVVETIYHREITVAGPNGKRIPASKIVILDDIDLLSECPIRVHCDYIVAVENLRNISESGVYLAERSYRAAVFRQFDISRARRRLRCDGSVAISALVNSLAVR